MLRNDAILAGLIKPCKGDTVEPLKGKNVAETKRLQNKAKEVIEDNKLSNKKKK